MITAKGKLTLEESTQHVLFPKKKFPFSVLASHKLMLKKTTTKEEIRSWAYQCKISFNPNINNQATEVNFSQRREKSLSPPIIFSNNSTDFSLLKTTGFFL